MDFGRGARRTRRWKRYAGDQPERGRDDPGLSGYTFRYDRDRHGRAHRYLNVIPSKKALERERDQLRARINATQSIKPIPTLIAELNRHLKGWAAYCSFG